MQRGLSGQQGKNVWIISTSCRQQLLYSARKYHTEIIVQCSLYNYLIALQVISLNFKVQCFERPVTLNTVCLPFSKHSVSATGSYQLPTSAGALLTHTEDLVLWTEALMTVKGPAVLYLYQGIRIKFMEMFWEFIELLIR